MWCYYYSTIKETQDNTNVEDTPLVANNETMLNAEPECRSVGVGDVVADMVLISGVWILSQLLLDLS
jgi:hypothetical protein